MHQELPWDLTDEIECAETEAVGLLSSRSPLIAFGFPLNLSIASKQMSLNQSSSGSTLTTRVNSQLQMLCLNLIKMRMHGSHTKCSFPMSKQ